MLNIAAIPPSGKDNINSTVLLNVPHIVEKLLELMKLFTEENLGLLHGKDKS